MQWLYWLPLLQLPDKIIDFGSSYTRKSDEVL